MYKPRGGNRTLHCPVAVSVLEKNGISGDCISPEMEHPESNWGLTVHKAGALPTELCSYQNLMRRSKRMVLFLRLFAIPSRALGVH